MIDIRGLAYFVAQIDDIAEWKHYAENVLGMMTSAAPGGGLYIKMDERPFRILVVPVLGEDSGKATRKVGCAVDNAAAERMVLSADYSADLAQKPDCNLTPLQQRLVLASMIGLNGVPYLVLPSGKVQQGLPADLAALLAQG